MLKTVHWIANYPINDDNIYYCDNDEDISVFNFGLMPYLKCIYILFFNQSREIRKA